MEGRPFEYNAAYQNIDFQFDVNNMDQDGADKYFGMDRSKQSELCLGLVKQEIMSPLVNSPGDLNSSLSGYSTPQTSTKQKEVDTAEETTKDSTQEEEELKHLMDRLKMSAKKKPPRKSIKFDGLELPIISCKKDHQMETRLDTVVNTPKLELRGRSVNRTKEENIKMSDQPCNNICTVPFTLPDYTTNQKRKIESPPLACSQATKFISLAESLRKFHHTTPDRFHTKPARDDIFKPKLSQSHLVNRPRCTVAQSPALQAKSRSRPVHALSREQVELKELKEIQDKRDQSKALPLNPRVFKTPQLGVRVERRPITAFEPFKLTEVVKQARPNTPLHRFTARPVPKKILEGTTGLKEVLPAKITNPVTPSFLRNRKTYDAKHSTLVLDDQGNKIKQTIFHFGINMKKRPTPTKSKPQAPVGTTEVKAFSFDERDKIIQKKKEEKIQKLLEQEKKKREFHANPLPRSCGGSSINLIENMPILPNRLPMAYLDDGYAARREDRIKKKLAEEEEEVKKSANMFNARPASVVHAKPFTVRKAEMPLAQIQPFDLSTERRAKEREEYDKYVKQREKQFLEYKIQKEKELKEKEKEQILQIRQETIHKANPVPRYKPFEIHASDVPLTIPCAPFAKRATNSDCLKNCSQ